MVLTANIISFVGSLIMVGIGFIKERRRILLAQCAQWVIMSVSNLMLGGVTGLISNAVSILRNLYSLKKDLTKPVKYGFILLQILISIPFNHLGLLGWLPTMAAASFTLFLDFKDERVLKCAIIFGQILSAIFDISLKNYAAFAFDLFTCVTTLIGIWRIVKSRRQAEDMPRQR